MLLTLVLLHSAESQLAVRDVKLTAVETVLPGAKDYEAKYPNFILPSPSQVNKKRGLVLKQGPCYIQNPPRITLFEALCQVQGGANVF